VPRAILEQILEWEQSHSISLIEREILLDRLAELGLDWQVEQDEMQPILEGLIYHLQHYKYNLLGLEKIEGPYYWEANFTVH